jgi:hypothetical protein
VDDHAFEHFRNYPFKEADSGNIIISRSGSSSLKEVDGGDTIACRSRISYSKEVDGDIIALSYSRSILSEKAGNALVMDPIDVNTIEVALDKALMRARTDYLG